MSRFCLETIPFETGGEVAALCRTIFNEAFPGEDDAYIARYVADVEAMFTMGLPGYQPMDTAYHDLTHTLQAALCWAQMMANRHLAGVLPRISARHFRIGFVAVLLHDIGYLKAVGDAAGTGAKYTFVHEKRSCEMALVYLLKHGWSLHEIFMVQHLISCTGPRARIDGVPFFDEVDKLLGEALCTADYLGQMSDPGYIAKLPALYKEFEESDDYRGIPPGQRIFKSYEQLLQGTPSFWQKVVLPKLETECSGLYRFLGEPCSAGGNLYVEAVERNIRRIQDMAAFHHREAVAS